MALTVAPERTRSPRSPKHGLSEAVEYVKRIYEAVHRSTISSATAFELMGFNGKSGASTSALGSMRQFGLIEGTGERTKVSDLTLAILEPSSSDEFDEALREAADKPDAFRAIKSRFDGRIPPTDEPIRAYLIRELGFIRSGAEETIRSLRTTENFISSKSASETIIHSDEATQLASTPAKLEDDLPTPDQGFAEKTSVRVPLTKDCVADLRFMGPITQKGISNLIRYVELMRDVWASDDAEGADTHP